MEIFKVVVFICFVVYVKGQEDQAENNTTLEHTTTTCCSTILDVKNNSVNTTELDTKGDTIITRTPEITEKNASSPEEQPTTTEIIVTTKTVSSTEKETVPPTSNWTMCSSNPCKNGATCLENSTIPGAFSCSCKLGYLGVTCAIKDECFVHENGDFCHRGKCTYSDDRRLRSCRCFSKMYWDDEGKECKEAQPPCFPNPCLNSGTCIAQNSTFECQCETGYEGEYCAIRNTCGKEDHCENGKCVTDTNQAIKYCKCDDNFYWNEDTEECETVAWPCKPNPCKHSGICLSTSSGDWNCSCSGTYSGATCEEVNFCLGDKEEDGCNNGICIKIGDTKLCQCDPDYYLDETTHTCKEIHKPCLPNPCANDGLCIALPNSTYNCTCSKGFSGKDCENLDLCILDGGNAFCGEAACVNDLDEHSYHCNCSSGQYFDYAERKCKDLDLCPLMECGSTEICENSLCGCKKHFLWNNETHACEPNFCASKPCSSDEMVCKEGDGEADYHCECKEGHVFNGSHCNNAFCVFPTLNTCNQVCESTKDGYICGCADSNFQLKEDNSTCEYIGNITCVNKTCSKGSCIVKEDQEVCICPPGHTEIMGKCVVNTRSPEPCPYLEAPTAVILTAQGIKYLCTANMLPKSFCPDDRCDPVDKGFRCKCEGKYVLSEDKVTCTVRKMCHKSEKGWSTCAKRNAACIEDITAPEGYHCQCLEGYAEADQGICQDICSFDENQRECSVLGATCEVKAGGEKTCKCPPYFQRSKNGTTCNRLADVSYLLTLPLDATTYRKQNLLVPRRKRALEEASVISYRQIQIDIQESIGKLFSEFHQANILNCILNSEFILCKVELQFMEASEIELNRFKVSEICQSDGSNANCLLPPSLVLRKDQIKKLVTIQKTNPCDKDIKEDLCGSETSCWNQERKNSFSCTCKTGFTARNKIYPVEDSETFIEICKDVDECIENPCPAHAQCTNTIGSYLCSCSPGYRVNKDSNQESCVEICNPNPCVHGHCTENGDHGFECRCDAGYSGAMCNLQDENFKDARLNTIIVGAVLGGILLLTIILFVASVARLRKKKFVDDSGNMLYNAAEMTERRPADAGAINNAYQRE